MSYPLFAGELFRRTRGKETFSSNDLYDQKWENLFQHYNQIGAFFRFLETKKYAEQTGDHERSTQKQAKGRLVKTYKWTVKAWNRFNR
jgi:hypothetical protein